METAHESYASGFHSRVQGAWEGFYLSSLSCRHVLGFPYCVLCEKAKRSFRLYPEGDVSFFPRRQNIAVLVNDLKRKQETLLECHIFKQVEQND